MCGWAVQNGFENHQEIKNLQCFADTLHRWRSSKKDENNYLHSDSVHQTNPLLDTFRENMKNIPQDALSCLTGSSIDKIKKMTRVEIEEIVDGLLEILPSSRIPELIKFNDIDEYDRGTQRAYILTPGGDLT